MGDADGIDGSDGGASRVSMVGHAGLASVITRSGLVARLLTLKRVKLVAKSLF